MQVLTIPIQLASLYPSSLVEFALPLPKGTANTLKHLGVRIDDKQIEASAQITAVWNDGSIKMCVISFFSSNTLDSNNRVEVFIVNQATQGNINESVPITRLMDNKLKFDTQYLGFSYDLSTNTFELHNKQEDLKQTGKLAIIDSDNALLVAKSTTHKVVSQTSLTDLPTQDEKIIIDGSFISKEDQTVCLFTLTFCFYNNGRLFKLNTTIHNPHSAEHVSGLWDLGDPQSFLFNSCGVSFEYASAQSFKLKIDEFEKTITSPTAVTQYSSGGDNWQSPVHHDKNQNIPFMTKGFQVTESDNIIHSGMRATPIVDVSMQQHVAIKHFWQNFPMSLVISEHQLNINFFPQLENQPHELQGGEKKTHELWCQIGSNDNRSLDWVDSPVSIKLSTEWLKQTHLAEFIALGATNEVWQSIIHNGIEGDSNFFDKRETLDEYGWRNFGDIYADHETAEYNGDDIFVSHYNNQYDPILGFLKQYIITGDKRWQELANDLARHVVDIDIYHTEEDKDEYNGGLFWHTDHYVAAYTSSHRSYSKHQPSDVYQDHAGGGGPGGQHCYTSGLALHYMLSGDVSSKEAVLTLTNWITNVYEGSSSCLELLLAFKNRHIPGYKNHFTGQYPLDRGTANYVVALLDSYELTQERHFLNQAEHVFRHSFHPNEDICDRGLEDVEGTWFYTVLLQAVCKYLAIKESMQELDEHFYYNRDSLLNFARWMVLNEKLYLEKPEILEYPNDTWTAQDLRKVHIFAAAHYYCPRHTPVFLQKAEQFELDISNRLNSSTTKTYTRIMVLVLQNYGYLDLFKNKVANVAFEPIKFNWPSANYQNKSIVSGFLIQMLKRLSKISIHAELDWLKKRLK